MSSVPHVSSVPYVSSVPPGRIVLVRHGETAWSQLGRHTGRTDLPLLPVGERQATALRTLLDSYRFALVATSPRRRAVHTADLAGLDESAPRVERRVVWDDLAEWDYGQYEGLTTAQIRAEAPGWTVWAGTCPDGETAGQVGARADAVLARVRPVLESGDVALVGHGHMLRVLIARWLAMVPTAGASFALAAGGMSLLGHEHETPALHRLNVLPLEAAGQAHPPG